MSTWRGADDRKSLFVKQIEELREIADGFETLYAGID